MEQNSFKNFLFPSFPLWIDLFSTYVLAAKTLISNFLSFRLLILLNSSMKWQLTLTSLLAWLLLAVSVASATLQFNSNCTHHFTTVVKSSDDVAILQATNSSSHQLGRLLSQRPSQLPNKVELCQGGAFATSYEPSKLNPHFSTWQVTTAQARSYIVGRNSFIQDSDLRAIKVPQANGSSNVWSTEWNRGHLAPSRMLSYSEWSKDQTYHYSNVAPQWWYFNQQRWEKLEENLFVWVRDRNDTVLYITTGVEYEPWRRIQDDFVFNDSVAMPDYYFTAICDVASGESAAFFSLNQNDDGGMLQRYRTVRELELELYGAGGNVFDRVLCRTTSPVNASHWGFSDYVTNADTYGPTPGLEDGVNLTLWFRGNEWSQWLPNASHPNLNDICDTPVTPCSGDPKCAAPNLTAYFQAASYPSPQHVEDASAIRDIVVNSLRLRIGATMGWRGHFGFMFEVPLLVPDVAVNSTQTAGLAVRVVTNFNRTLKKAVASKASEAGFSSLSDYVADIVNGARFSGLETWYASRGGVALPYLTAIVVPPARCIPPSAPTNGNTSTTEATSGTETTTPTQETATNLADGLVATIRIQLFGPANASVHTLQRVLFTSNARSRLGRVRHAVGNDIVRRLSLGLGGNCTTTAVAPFRKRFAGERRIREGMSMFVRIEYYGNWSNSTVETWGSLLGAGQSTASTRSAFSVEAVYVAGETTTPTPAPWLIDTLAELHLFLHEDSAQRYGSIDTSGVLVMTPQSSTSYVSRCGPQYSTAVCIFLVPTGITGGFLLCILVAMVVFMRSRCRSGLARFQRNPLSKGTQPRFDNMCVRQQYS